MSEYSGGKFRGNFFRSFLVNGRFAARQWREERGGRAALMILPFFKQAPVMVEDLSHAAPSVACLLARRVNSLSRRKRLDAGLGRLAFAGWKSD